jgi:uncharacterized membrane protein
MTKDYRTLDAILVTACLVELGFVLGALAFVKIPQENLPILAGLASGVIGTTLGAYAGARWGNNKTTTRQPDPAEAEPKSEAQG